MTSILNKKTNIIIEIMNKETKKMDKNDLQEANHDIDNIETDVTNNSKVLFFVIGLLFAVTLIIVAAITFRYLNLGKTPSSIKEPTPELSQYELFEKIGHDKLATKKVKNTMPESGILDDSAGVDGFGEYKDLQITFRRNYGIVDIETTTTKIYTNVLSPNFLRGASLVTGDTNVREVIEAKRASMSSYCDETKLCEYRLFSAGSVEINSVAQPLYYFFTQFNGMGSGWEKHLLIVNDNRLIKLVEESVINKENNYIVSSNYDSENSSRMWIDAYSIMSDLDSFDYDVRISIPESNNSLTYRKSLGTSFMASSWPAGILDVAQERLVDYSKYSTSTTIFVDSIHGAFYRDESDSTFHNIDPTGMVHIYDLDPYFYNIDIPEEARKSLYTVGYLVDIIWHSSSTTNSTDTYSWAGDFGYGCGGVGMAPCTNVVNEKEWFNEDGLTEIGRTTANNEAVYELTDKAGNEYYQELFNFGYQGNQLAQGNSMGDVAINDSKGDYSDEYQSFLEDEPLFFWKDMFGDWRSYRKTKYRSLAECGKPVIYLYPETEMDVNVKVAPNEGFTKVEPDYPEDGWTVRATPESELYNYDDDTSYPYLFWEGHTTAYERPQQGFVLSREEVPEKARELLYRTGLNEKETEDFMEFWEEKLMVKDYVFITFVDQPTFDQLAPLTVTPAPDSIIRVFMDYTPLDEPVTVEPLHIRTPERHGFAVVEWGGAFQ